MGLCRQTTGASPKAGETVRGLNWRRQQLQTHFMNVVGDYHKTGFSLVENLISPEVATALLHRLKQDMGPSPIQLSNVKQHPTLLQRPAFEVYGYHYPPMLSFLWGLTPLVSELLGKDLLPTYD